MVDGIDLLSIVKELSQTEPDVAGDARGMYKWMERDTGQTVGYMGVSKGNPEDVAKMVDYSMQGYQGIEKVKIAPGERAAGVGSTLLNVMLVVPSVGLSAPV